MMYRNGRYYDRMIRNGVTYDRMVRNGVTYGGSNSLDPATAAILDYASLNGYSPVSDTAKYDSFIRTIKQSGVWDKLDVFYLFATDGDNGFRLINMVNPGSHDGTITGGVVSTSSGFVGNGVDGYISTNYTPSSNAINYAIHNASIGCISTATGACQVSELAATFRVLLRNDNSMQFRFNSTSAASGSTIPALTTGMVAMIQPSETEFNFVINGVLEQRGYAFTSGKLLPTAPLVLYRTNSTFYTTGSSLLFIGAALTLQEVNDIQSAFNVFVA